MKVKHIMTFLTFLSLNIFAQSEFIDKIQDTSKVNQDTASFKRGQAYLGFGFPGLIN